MEDINGLEKAGNPWPNVILGKIRSIYHHSPSVLGGLSPGGGGGGGTRLVCEWAWIVWPT